jgi:hypothetical protein
MNVIQVDSVSHVENAARVLFSRDPHLAAIGWILAPIPQLALLPIVPFKFVWPAVTSLGIAATIVSALFTAGSVLQISGTLREAGVRPAVRAALSAAFAIHPMVFFFGANGMSEAVVIFFLVLAVRHLSRWLRGSDLDSLIKTGLAMGMAYLSRYEALPAAAAVVLLVTAISFVRNRREPSRYWGAISDAAIVAMPIGLAFVGWAVASWVITGHPIEHLTSAYGNRTQLLAMGLLRPWSPELLRLITTQVLSLEVLLPAVAVLALWPRSLYRDVVSIAAVTVLGPVVAFGLLAAANGTIDYELRHFMFVVPLTVFLAGACLSTKVARPAGSVQTSRLGLSRVLAITGVIVALPVAGFSMLDATINPYAAGGLQSVVLSHRISHTGVEGQLEISRRVAADLDRESLPAGSVLVDDFLGARIVVASDNPHQFVITSDRDFQAVLSDPTLTGVKFVVVPLPQGLGLADAVNRQYPEMYANGAGLATLVREYVNPEGNFAWRLYRLN